MGEQLISASTVEDEKLRILGQYHRKLSEYKDVEQRLRELRKKVCNIFF